VRASFSRILVVQRRQDRHVDTLRGCVLSRVGGSSRVERDVTSYADWRSALVEVLRLPVDDIPADDLAALFARVRGAHDAWDSAGRP
jgi:hypothetical protein